MVALALGAPLIGSCGGTSRNGGTSSSAGAAGGLAGNVGNEGGARSSGGTSSHAGAHAGGSPAAGTPSAPAGGAPIDVGGRNAAADKGFGGVTDIGGEGSAGGATDQQDGWPCGDQRCSVGQTCIHCLIEQTSRRCVPSPDQDPTGYASATAACESPPFGREDCDGPEDCPASQYCVANEGTRCQPQPSTKHSCCFACDALTDCTLCHTDQDCLSGESCEPNEVSDTRGCHLVR